MGQRLNNSCLVCADEAQRLMTTSDPGPIVKVEKIKEIDYPEDEFITADDDIPNHHFLLEDSEVEKKEHLKPLFILNRIFKLPEESIGDLLVQLEYATNGVQLCSHCDERARQFHQTLQQVSELQLILDEIEKEFKEKIEKSKNVPSSFRERIRCCFEMTDSFSELHSKPDRNENDDRNRNQYPDKVSNNKESVRAQREEVELVGTSYVIDNHDDYEVDESDLKPGTDENDEYNQNLNPDSLNIDIEESFIIKTEEVDLGTFDGTLISEVFQPLPSTPLEFVTYDNDDDEVDKNRDNLPSNKRKKQEERALPSKKKFKSLGAIVRSHPTIIRKKRKSPIRPILYKCPYCPHKTTAIRKFKLHQKCHEEDSKATACIDCGIFVQRQDIGIHGRHCLSIFQNRLAIEKNLQFEDMGEKRCIQCPHPNYITFKRRNSPRIHYQCLQCPYENVCNSRMLAHTELHEEGSLAAPCGECGWFLLPQHLDTHREINHTAVVKELPIIPAGPSSAALPKFKCSECSYECQASCVLHYHLTGHNYQVTESKCKDCGCHLSLRLSKKHKIHCFARVTQDAAEETEDTSESEGENLMELVE